MANVDQNRGSPGCRGAGVLIPFQYDGKRLWAAIAVTYDRQIYAGALETLQRYVVRSVGIDAVFPDEQITPAVIQAVNRLIDEGATREEAISRVADAYTISEAVTAEICSVTIPG